MLAFFLCTQKSHPTGEVLELKWLEVKGRYKAVLYICHSKAVWYPFLDALLHYMDVVWLRTLDHQRKQVQLQMEIVFQMVSF